MRQIVSKLYFEFTTSRYKTKPMIISEQNKQKETSWDEEKLEYSRLDFIMSVNDNELN